ncbi:MAG: hypothetical protein AAF542_08420 [Pseudomonadota bacterium]
MDELLDAPYESGNVIFLALTGWEQQDYIDDVLTEHFDIECEYQVVDDEAKIYRIFFPPTCRTELESAISEINAHHVKHGKIYQTI